MRYSFAEQGSLDILHLFVTQELCDYVADEVKKPGQVITSLLTPLPYFNDPAISNFALSVADALRQGTPEFYSQAAAQWITAHLLLGRLGAANWYSSLSHERVSDPRLIRTLEYIRSNLSERLDIRVLAKEAGLSPFHFSVLFKKALAESPHRHVRFLRMEAAQFMLRETDKSVLEIALTCGYRGAAQFSAAFRNHFSLSPSAYRLQEKTRNRALSKENSR